MLPYLDLSYRVFFLTVLLVDMYRMSALRKLDPIRSEVILNGTIPPTSI